MEAGLRTEDQGGRSLGAETLCVRRTKLQAKTGPTWRRRCTATVMFCRAWGLKRPSRWRPRCPKKCPFICVGVLVGVKKGRDLPAHLLTLCVYPAKERFLKRRRDSNPRYPARVEVLRGDDTAVVRRCSKIFASRHVFPVGLSYVFAVVCVGWCQRWCQHLSGSPNNLSAL
jgi:hypothetical protein